MDEQEIYAVAYYFGRAVGNDEDGMEELGDVLDDDRSRQAFKEGYERGVSDFCRDLDAGKVG
jgi:hypothetical protein